MKKSVTARIESVHLGKLICVAVFLLALGLTVTSSVHATPPVDAVWNMTFDDEFNGTNLDLTKWDPVDICCGNTDHEEYYLLQNCFVSNGILTEVFKNDGYGGKPYTSGAITSYYKQQYGYFEIHCQLPPGDGMWPAFWALQTTTGSFSGNGWEIDIMEGLGSMPNWIDSNVGHWVDGSASWNGCQYGSPYPPLNFQTAYHTFGWEWRTNNDFLFYVDNVFYCEETAAEGASIPALSVCANLQGAIDGGPDGYTPNVDATTPFPSYYNIDYIRIYQYGTATNPPATPTNVTATAGADR